MCITNATFNNCNYSPVTQYFQSYLQLTLLPYSRVLNIILSLTPLHHSPFHSRELSRSFLFLSLAPPSSSCLSLMLAPLYRIITLGLHQSPLHSLRASPLESHITNNSTNAVDPLP